MFLGDAYVRYSFALEGDVVGFPQELQKILVDAADRLMAEAYTIGNGTTEPRGVITALVGTASEINAAVGAVTAADPLALQAALPPRFSPNAKFMASLPVINMLAALDTSDQRQPPLPGDRQGRLLNRPLVENSDMDSAINATVTANNYVLLYGDFQNFIIIVDRVGITFEVVQHVLGANQRPTGERGGLLWFRTGSNVATINAFRLLDVPTTA